MAVLPPAPPASLAEVTDRLMAEFGALLSPPVVSRTVQSVRDSLASHAGEGGFLDLLATKAHERLTAMRLELLV